MSRCCCYHAVCVAGVDAAQALHAPTTQTPTHIPNPTSTTRTAPTSTPPACRRLDEPIVNGWLFVRYLVVGLYVGVATVAGFLWWFLSYPQGGRLTWGQLTNFQK